MGGVSPAKDYILKAIGQGKSVVTANKEIMADHGEDVLTAAEANRVDLLFEGSVGGGIPVLRPLKESLSGSRINRIMGIVNGTTNYILTQMALEGRSFAQALAEAQKLGYAEADPAADVEGHDAARKLAILASIAFGTRVKSRDIQTEGISRVTPADIEFGHSHGWTLKLLAVARDQDGEVEARVGPAFVDNSHPLARVGDAYNAIYVYGHGVGETMFYGLGAGGLPTGSAVVGDILQAARNRLRGVSFSACTCRRSAKIKGHEELTGRYYLRVEAGSGGAIAADVVQILDQHGVPLRTLEEGRSAGGVCQIGVISGECREWALRRASQAIGALPAVRNVGTLIRLESDKLGKVGTEAFTGGPRGEKSWL